MTPERLGRYRLLETLGRGGMGVVYRAHDPELDREVAVKALSAALLVEGEEREEFLERFRREARAAARLSHPGIVAVHDAGLDEASGTPYLVMELVPGVTLHTVLREQGALPVAQALEIVGEVGAALAEAHRAGIVHRDVKPGNVLLDVRGRARLADFGIARLPGSELTRAGAGLGTPGYAAPEVVRGGVADARSDLFSLAALAYALLTGRRPFDGPTPAAASLAVLEREPEPPAALRPGLPPGVSEAVLAALSKEPARRPATVADFLESLRASGPTVPATAVGAPSSRPEPTATVAAAPGPPLARGHRPRWPWLLLLALLLAGAAAGAWWWLRDDAPAGRPTPAPKATPSVRAARPAATPAATPAEPREAPERPGPPGKDRGKHKGRGKKKGGD